MKLANINLAPYKTCPLWRKLMKKSVLVLITSIVVFSLSLVSVNAQQALVESVVNGCNSEISTLCNDVVPGQARILACLYAHSDKLSGKCEYSLYDAAVQLERAISALTYTVNECSEDLEKHCMGVEVGEGRVVDCFEKNKSALSARCKDALEVVGLNK
jgi:hypothetical protein